MLKMLKSKCWMEHFFSSKRRCKHDGARLVRQWRRATREDDELVGQQWRTTQEVTGRCVVACPPPSQQSTLEQRLVGPCEFFFFFHTRAKLYISYVPKLHKLRDKLVYATKLCQNHTPGKSCKLCARISCVLKLYISKVMSKSYPRRSCIHCITHGSKLHKLQEIKELQK